MPWQLLDYPVARLGATVAGGTGATLLEFAVVPVDNLWRIDQVSVGIVGLTAAQVEIFEEVNVLPPTVLLYDQPVAAGVLPVQGAPLLAGVDGTLAYAFYNFDDQGSPLTIRGGDQLTVAFCGVSAGLRVQARVQYQYLGGVAGQPTPVAGAQSVAIPTDI